MSAVILQIRALLHRRAELELLVAGCVGLLGARCLRAQTDTAVVRAWAVRLDGDIGGVPDPFSSRCGDGTGGIPALGTGIAVIHRSRGWLVTTIDSHLTGSPLETGCKAVALAPVPVSPGVYETRSFTQYGRDVPAIPFVTSMLHAGAETPAGYPLARASLGAGVIWSRRPLPVGSAAAGLGSRGAGTRVYAELELFAARVHGTEPRTRYRMDSTTITPISTTVLARNSIAKWGALHLGMDVPVATRR